MNYFAASCEVSLRASSYRTIHPRRGIMVQ